jgi:GTP-binding protein EngB required for normal cell division
VRTDAPPSNPEGRAPGPVDATAGPGCPDVDLAGALREVADVAGSVGVDHLPAEAAALAERLAEGRFFVACVGQFKRGKSTLLNALVGEPVLPTGVVPVTTVVTVLRHGPRRAARIRLRAEGWRDIDPGAVGAYVTEGENPGNRKGVEAVEIFVPSPLLASGMCLVDTPGLGSVFADSTRVTRDFVPHIDAALVVLGADPPLSGEELTLVEEVARHTAALLFLLNKADRLSAADRDEARRFAEEVLGQRLRRPVGPLFEISATERLASGPTRDWARLEAALADLARQSGRQLVEAAAARGVDRLVERLLGAIAQHREALVRPLDESERRLAALRQAGAQAQRALRDLRPLFAAEQERLARAFEMERRVFLRQAVPEAVEELERGPLAGRTRRGWRDAAMEAARAVARRRVEAWLREVEPRAEALYAEATRRFVELANGALAALRGSGTPAVAGLPADLLTEVRFRARRQFYATDLMGVADGGIGRALVVGLAPRRLARALVRRDARAYLERLLDTNSARAANDLAERVVESRRQLESLLTALLQEITQAAEHAVQQARVHQQAGAAAVQAELARLDGLRRRVERFRPWSGGRN